MSAVFADPAVIDEEAVLDRARRMRVHGNLVLRGSVHRNQAVDIVRIVDAPARSRHRVTQPGTRRGERPNDLRPLRIVIDRVECRGERQFLDGRVQRTPRFIVRCLRQIREFMRGCRNLFLDLR